MAEQAVVDVDCSDEATHTTTRCPLCGGTTHTFTQPALMAGRADTTMVRCDDPRCDLTLDSRDVATFDASLYRTMRTEFTALAQQHGMMRDLLMALEAREAVERG